MDGCKRTAKLTTLVLFAGLFLAAAAGCQDDKLKEENAALMQQNRQLNAQSQNPQGNTGPTTMTDQSGPVETVTPSTMAEPATMEASDGNDVFPPEGSGDNGGVSIGVNKHGETTITVPSDVLFASGSATLKSSAKKSLDKVAAIIKSKHAGDTLRIEGYTDSTPIRKGTWDDNWDLGAARARSVALYLISKGVPKHHIYIASFADNDPKSAKNLALNRRVEIVVVK